MLFPFATRRRFCIQGRRKPSVDSEGLMSIMFATGVILLVCDTGHRETDKQALGDINPRVGQYGRVACKLVAKTFD